MSKEKQIEEMGELCPFYEEGKCLLLEEDAEECDMNCDMCRFAETLYNAGYRKQEWISVDERLPEENTEVLIYCKTNSSKEVFFVDKIRYFRGLAIWQVWSGKVTHWMPLPEPPKMKGGAE